MSISVTGLGSGLNYDEWIEKLVAIKQSEIDKVSVKAVEVGTQKSTLSTLQTKYADLLDSIQSFTKALSLNDVFKQKTVSSSNEAVSAKVTAYAGVQTVNVAVSNLATATTAKSASVVASKIDGSTLLSKLAEGSVKDGTFSIYVDGAKKSIAVSASDTMDTFLGKVTAATGLAATVDSGTGKVTIGAGSTSEIVVGSNADTSNIAGVLSLAKNEDGSYTSSKSIFDTNSNDLLTNAEFAGDKVTAGTFKIGNAEFTINSETTLKSLISKINNSADAGVSAYWDANSGKLSLESKSTGAININVEKGTSNFTDILGLTTDGKIAENSQTLGVNAKLTINDTEIISTSNTISSDISGITGLTLTLNDKTTTAAKVAVTTDSSAAATAIEDLVDKLNTVFSETDKATSTSGDLYGESILSSLKNRIRTMTTASVDGSETYKSLANIGITSGAVSTNINADTTKLVVDTDALTAALESDPEAVMKLLLGDDATGTKGVLDKIETVVDDSLDPLDGYFVNRKYSYEKQMKEYEKKVETMTDRMESYQKQLEAKFAAMDKLISSLQNQASVFDSYFGENGSATKSK